MIYLQTKWSELFPTRISSLFSSRSPRPLCLACTTATPKTAPWGATLTSPWLHHHTATPTRTTTRPAGTFMLLLVNRKTHFKLLRFLDLSFVVALCRYLGLRNEKGEFLPEYFHLLAIRLSFIIIFEVSLRSEADFVFWRMWMEELSMCWDLSLKWWRVLPWFFLSMWSSSLAA